MKRACYTVIIAILSNFCLAQQTPDREKLLEFYQNQRYGEAANYLSEFYNISQTTDIKILGQIAYCHMMAGNLIEAEKNYQNINQLNPNQVSVLFNLANINARRGNHKIAISYLQQLINIDSTNFNAYKQLANYTDNPTIKIAYLEKAHLLHPTEADVAYDLAISYRHIKQYQAGYEVLQSAIVADTANFVLQQALLPIANQLKKHTEVVVVGEKLLRNGDANVMKDLAMAYFSLKKYDKAINLYQVLERLSMQNETTLYYTTLSYYELKDYEMAAEYARKTIAEGISPNTGAYYSLLGSIYEEKKQLTQAGNTYKRGLTYDANKNTYYRLALLYDLKLKQPQSALNYYTLYLKSKGLDSTDQAQIAYVKHRIAILQKK